MALTETGEQVSFSLSAKNWADTKRAERERSAQSLASCRRSGCSPAEPYPPHECYQSTISNDSSLAKGTSLFCILGDISILH
jgi:hypothetical protein